MLPWLRTSILESFRFCASQHWLILSISCASFSNKPVSGSHPRSIKLGSSRIGSRHYIFFKASPGDLNRQWGWRASDSPVSLVCRQEDQGPEENDWPKVTPSCSVVQSCRTLRDPVDCNPPGSSVRGIFQARILERSAISYSRGSSQPKDRPRISCISCIGRQSLYQWTTWEVLSHYIHHSNTRGRQGIGFSRLEYHFYSSGTRMLSESPKMTRHPH